MVARTTQLQPEQSNGGGSFEPLGDGTSAARRRSWENRGRSQVVFNGSPAIGAVDFDDQPNDQPALKRVEQLTDPTSRNDSVTKWSG